MWSIICRHGSESTTFSTGAATLNTAGSHPGHITAIPVAWRPRCPIRNMISVKTFFAVSNSGASAFLAKPASPHIGHSPQSIA
jgi:hypothetical protein